MQSNDCANSIFISEETVTGIATGIVIMTMMEEIGIMTTIPTTMMITKEIGILTTTMEEVGIMNTQMSRRMKIL
jgi:hypothetical protein